MKSILISLLTLLIFGGGGYYGYTTYLLAEPQGAAPVLQTAQVRRGDLVLTAGGIGTLFAGEESKVGFRSSGIVSSVAAQVGERVDVDQILATLEYDSALNSQLISAQINQRLAEIALIVLTGEAGAADLAAAQSSLAAAQAEYDHLVAPPTAEEVNAARSELLSAQKALETLLAGPSQDAMTSLEADLRSAEVARAAAQAAYDRVAWRNDVGTTTQAADLQTATLAYEKALAQYNIGASGAAEEDIESARAQVSQARNTLNLFLLNADQMEVAAARAKVEQNRAALEDLLDGPSAAELEQAELAVEQARLAAQDVQTRIVGGTVRAPMAGVVTSVSVQPGDSVGEGPIIGLANTDTAQVRFWIEELDIAAAVPGFPVSILIDAFPEYRYSGQITRVEPALVEVDGASAIQAWASIDMTQHAAPLLFGMNAEVEIIAGEARNALLVPVQALRQIAPGQFAVFVLSQNLGNVSGVSLEQATTQNVKGGTATMTAVSIVGVTADFLAVRDYSVAHGRFFTHAEDGAVQRVAVLGAGIAQDLFEGVEPLGQQVRIGSSRFTVIGVMAQQGVVGATDNDGRIYIPASVVFKKFGGSGFGGNRVRMILVKAESGEMMDSVINQITSLLSARRNVDPASPDFGVRTQQDIVDARASTTAAFRSLLAWVAAVSLVVGGIGIMNIMLVSVTERTREIGLRQALGARPRDVQRQFLLEAVMLSLVGGLAGLLIGVAGSFVFGQLGGMRTELVPLSLPLVFGASAAVGIFFGYYPATQAARLDPIEALRRE